MSDSMRPPIVHSGVNSLMPEYWCLSPSSILSTVGRRESAAAVPARSAMDDRYAAAAGGGF